MVRDFTLSPMPSHGIMTSHTEQKFSIALDTSVTGLSLGYLSLSVLYHSISPVINNWNLCSSATFMLNLLTISYSQLVEGICHGRVMWLVMWPVKGEIPDGVPAKDGGAEPYTPPCSPDVVLITAPQTILCTLDSVPHYCRTYWETFSIFISETLANLSQE